MMMTVDVLKSIPLLLPSYILVKLLLFLSSIFKFGFLEIGDGIENG